MKRKFSVFGDSISTFLGLIPEENRSYYDSDNSNGTGVYDSADTWWMQVIDSLDGELLANASFSGALVDGAGFPAACAAERAEQLLGENGEQPDVVLAFMGINDYGWGSADAQAVKGSESAPKCVSAEDFPDVDPFGPAPEDAIERFEAAYSKALSNIHDVAPQADVWCINLPPGRVAGNDEIGFCYTLRGVELDDYNAAIARTAAKHGAKLADVRALGFDYDSLDGTHPTKKGMAQFANMVLAAMANAEGDEEAADRRMAGYPEYLRSRRSCTGKAGCNCPRSVIGPAGWQCICNPA